MSGDPEQDDALGEREKKLLECLAAEAFSAYGGTAGDPEDSGNGADDEGRLETFRKRYWEDQDAQGVRPLEEYLAMFPGHARAIAREYLALEEESSHGSSSSSAFLDAGDRLGPYEVVRELGRGGQGVVYLAEDTRLHRKVALKLLSNIGPGSEAMLKRFWREAEVASKLEHPGICGVHEASVERGAPFIAMRYVEGETLASKIATLKKETEISSREIMLSTERRTTREDTGADTPWGTTSSSVSREDVFQITEMFEKAARALHAAHEVGIIHRDIKPGNIMLTSDAQPVILDFGLARDDEALATLTRSGELFGTPAYMSPEQLMAQRIRLDRRTDVWSLGVALFECLTLRRPFQASTRQGLYQAIMTEEPPDPRRLNRAISKDLKTVVETALEKSRNDRYQTALDLAEDLRRVREVEPITATPIGAVGRTVRWAKRRPYQASLCVLVLIMVGAGSYLTAKWPEYQGMREKARLQEVDERRSQAERYMQDGYLQLWSRHSREEAMVAFRKALELTPDSVEAIAGMAIAAMGESTETLAYLDRHQTAVREHASLQAIRIEALRRLGRTAEAGAIQKNLSPPASSLDFFTLALSQMEHARDVDSRASFNEVPNPPAREAYSRALKSATKAIYRSSHAPRLAYYCLWTSAAENARDLVLACECADALTTIWPNSAYAWYWRGRALFAEEDRVRQLAAYRKALEIRPDSHAVLEVLALTLQQCGDSKEALSVARECVRGKPDCAIAHSNLGGLLRESGFLDEAINEHRKAILMDPNMAEGYCNLGKALSAKGLVDEAIEAYREAIAHRPVLAAAHCGLGNALSDKGLHDEAVQEYREAIRCNPGYAEAHCNIGNSLFAKGLVDPAVVEYQEALRLNPNLPEAHNGLAIVFYRTGRLDASIREYREAIRLKHDYAEAHYDLGNALRRKGLTEEAIEEYRSVIRLKPDHAEALCNLGQMLRLRGEFRKALEYLRLGHELGSRRPEWRYGSQRWLDECERLVAMKQELDAVLSGNGPSVDGDRLRSLTSICRLQGRFADAAELWKEAASRTGDVAARWRFEAARFAALAGTGHNRKKLDAKTMTDWRARALSWLHEELKAGEGLYRQGEIRENRLARRLQNWKRDGDLASVRGAAIEELPQDEHQLWKEFWASVDRLLEEFE